MVWVYVTASRLSFTPYGFMVCGKQFVRGFTDGHIIVPDPGFQDGSGAGQVLMPGEVIQYKRFKALCQPVHQLLFPAGREMPG